MTQPKPATELKAAPLFPKTKKKESKKTKVLSPPAIVKDSAIPVVLSAVAGNGLITIAKSACWLLSGSPSMLAETIHSFADTCNQILLYVGIQQGNMGPSDKFPLGKASARYLWNLISAVGIFFVGFGVTTYHGVYSLITMERDIGYHLDRFSLIVLLIAFLIEGLVLRMAIRAIRKDKQEDSFWEYIRRGDDPTSVAVLLEDGIAVIGVTLAAAGIGLSQWTQSPIPDAIASIVIGILLGIMAVLLALANGRLLIGVSSPEAEEEEIREFLANHRSVERVAKLKTVVLGPDQVGLSAEIEFHGGILLDRKQLSKDAEKIRSGEEDPLPILVDTAERMVRVVGKEINVLESRLRKKFPQLKVIELEVN